MTAMDLNKAIQSAALHQWGDLTGIAESLEAEGLNNEDAWRLTYVLASHGSGPGLRRTRQGLSNLAKMVPASQRRRRITQMLKREFPSIPASLRPVVHQFILAKMG